MHFLSEHDRIQLRVQHKQERDKRLCDRIIERLWKWMKESVIYNAYYEHFAEFKTAVIGFLTTLPRLAAGSELFQAFRSRVRDQFRLIGAT